MTADILTKPRFDKSNKIAQKLFGTKNPQHEKSLADARRNFAWLLKNKENLREEYGGRYVAIHKNSVCIADPSPVGLVRAVRKRYGDDPSVVVGFIEKERVKFLL